jgi:hypothetical protein
MMHARCTHTIQKRPKAERSLFAFYGPGVVEFRGVDFYFCIFVVGRTIMPASYRSLSFIEA